jgi:hypothetical protein
MARDFGYCWDQCLSGAPVLEVATFVLQGTEVHEGGDNHKGDAHEDMDQGWVSI